MPESACAALCALAVTSPNRLAELPDVPTIGSRYCGRRSRFWTALFAPKGTPKEIVSRLEAEVNQHFLGQEKEPPSRLYGQRGGKHAPTRTVDCQYARNERTTDRLHLSNISANNLIFLSPTNRGFWMTISYKSSVRECTGPRDANQPAICSSPMVERVTPRTCGGRRRGIVAVLLAIFVAVTSATQCISANWTSKQDLGNRYEGIIQHPVAAAELELMSFAGQFEPFTAADARKLSVYFFVPGSASAIVNARELNLRKFYWMESKPHTWKVDTWNVFEPWDTDSVLKANTIGSDNLGIVVWLDGIDGTTVAPAFIVHSAQPQKVDKYVLHFRPRGNLTEIKYRVAPDSVAAGDVIQSSETGNWTATEPLRLTINANTLPAGWVTLMVRTRFLNEPLGPPQQFRFYHAADVPKS
ncbi:hypothetical protein JQ636_12430 [Bradyrhizobium japonicum]|uniref:tripartite tricarboxylate transporter substrate-binding protein n=1 Tax=Bradyrhizobium japonicum TaxID=375 RepID=UPI001BA98F6A|nr:tripartite tricarboxylate transporter substrate-binding protein [Bradyrhizobium japonicum]MBR0804347.1 hypothetical protein [Bradyrhizobium japonicum]